MNYLRSIWLEITPKCNLRCIHCYAESSPSQPLELGLSPNIWHELLVEANSLGCKGVQFIGGEPTLYPHLGSLIQRADSLGYTGIEVLTNGTTITDSLLQCFLKYNVSLAISVYSIDPKIHDQVTGTRGSLAKTLQAIKKAVNANVKVRASVISMEENSGTTSLTKEYLLSIGVGVVRVGRVRHFGRARKEDSYGIIYEDELCGRCGDGQVCIAADGSIYPCIMAKEFSVGHVASGLKAAYEGEKMQEFREIMNKKNSQVYNASRTCAPDNDCHPNTCEPDSNNRTCAPDNDCHPNTCEPDSNNRTYAQS